MSRFVRASKYRHVFGQSGKKEYCIDNAKVSGSAWDTNLIACSGSYISLNWNSSGGGAFAILPLPSPFRPLPHALLTKLPDIIPLARGHTAPVLDTSWNPFDDSVVASGAEDGKALLWKVSEDEFVGWGGDKWQPVDFEPVVRIDASPRKIGQVLFHPSAAHVLATATGEHTIKLWDLNNTDDPRSTLGGHTDTIQSITFNQTGTLMASTSRDRKIRIFDPRTGGAPVYITEGHGGIKGARLTWMSSLPSFATTGFSKMSDRQVGIWDMRQGEGLNNVKMLTIDQTSGVLMPFWSDNNILFLAGKGDGNIRYYEYESSTLHALSEHKSSDPQRGMCFLPRRALNTSECEIARAYKVAGSTVEPIAFVVPRKADSFQSDIFPLAPSAEPSLSASEFFSSGGKDIALKLVNLDSGAITASAASASSASLPTPAPTKTSSAPAPSPAPAPESSRPIPKSTDSLPPISKPTPVRSPSPERPPSIVDSPMTGPGPSNPDAALQDENARLTSELRDARAQIRNLELQVESMRANAQRAAKALLESGGV